MIRFVATRSGYGTRHVIGPTTGIGYTITEQGVPISEYDYEAIIRMTIPPCCGDLPFDGQVKLFHEIIPTQEQMESIPEMLYDPLYTSPELDFMEDVWDENTTYKDDVEVE